MDYFLSCDWGTSAFRLRLIRNEDLIIVSEFHEGVGIAETYNQWKSHHPALDSRSAFYSKSLQTAIKALGEHVETSLQGTPIVISGMASSSIGMVELPYKRMPFALDGADLVVEKITEGCLENPVLIISGACTANDVMRGEETKVLGCSSLLAGRMGRQLLIFPGTHPKHLVVDQGLVVGLVTYMTGEFFELLSVYSVLASSVKEGTDFGDPRCRYWFSEGVDAGVNVGVLQSAFNVRTNQLLKGVPEEHNFYYLSGLLIGAELAGVDRKIPVFLISGTKHDVLYRSALSQLGIAIAGAMDADVALIRGQQKILNALFPI